LRNYLKTYRKRSGLSQRELTYLLGQKHRAKVSRYERNERTPALRTLIGYETIFRVVLRDLFRGVFVDIAPGILDRARTLSRVLDGQQRTRAVGQKVDFLNKVIESLRPKP
jgi:transcriptional regulator with XRE-family HTH domain